MRVIYMIDRLTVVHFLQSYLSDCTLRVSVNNLLSEHALSSLAFSKVQSLVLSVLTVHERPASLSWSHAVTFCSLLQHVKPWLCMHIAAASTGHTSVLPVAVMHGDKYREIWGNLLTHWSPAACQTLSLEGKPIRFKWSEKYLGVWLDQHLTFSFYMTHTIQKVHSIRAKLIPCSHRTATWLTIPKLTICLLFLCAILICVAGT